MGESSWILLKKNENQAHWTCLRRNIARRNVEILQYLLHLYSTVLYCTILYYNTAIPIALVQYCIALDCTLYGVPWSHGTCSLVLPYASPSLWLSWAGQLLKSTRYCLLDVSLGTVWMAPTLCCLLNSLKLSDFGKGSCIM